MTSPCTVVRHGENALGVKAGPGGAVPLNEEHRLPCQALPTFPTATNSVPRLALVGLGFRVVYQWEGVGGRLGGRRSRRHIFGNRLLEDNPATHR